MSILQQDLCPTQATSPREIDQRRNPRYLCIDRGILRLCVRPEFRGRRALMVDISSSGIGFLLQDRLEPGAILVFELKDGAGTIGRIAHVRHCRPHPVTSDAPWLPQTPALSQFFRRLLRVSAPQPAGEAWLVGCEFDQPLNEDEMKQLLEQLTSLRADR